MVAMAHENPKRLLEMVQTEHPGYHPILAIANMVHKPEVREDFKLALDCHKTILRYVEPEVKAMEVSGNLKHDHGVLKVSLLNEEDDDAGDEVPEE